MEWLGSRVLRSARPFVPNSHSLDGIGGQQPKGDQDDQAMLQTMCDLMLGEIQTEMDRVHKDAEYRRQEELKLTKQPDYSWLIDWKLRAKRPLGFRESSEVESLCAKMRPGDWRPLLAEWRRRARFADSRDAVLQAFRQSVDLTVAERMQRECRLESVDEHDSTTASAGGGMERSMMPTSLPKPPAAKEKRRPETARPATTGGRRQQQTTLLNVFTLQGLRMTVEGQQQQQQQQRNEGV